MKLLKFQYYPALAVRDGDESNGVAAPPIPDRPTRTMSIVSLFFITYNYIFFE